MMRSPLLASTRLLFFASALFAVGCGSAPESSMDAPESEGTAPALEGEAAPAAPAAVDEGDTTEIEAVSPEEAAALLEAHPEIVVLDIRRPDEFDSGHIDGALNVEYGAEGFETELSELDRDQAYLVHCRSGSRSSASLPVFESLGFRKLYHLDSGFQGWQGAGLPVEQ